MPSGENIRERSFVIVMIVRPIFRIYDVATLAAAFNAYSELPFPKYLSFSTIGKEI